MANAPLGNSYVWMKEQTMKFVVKLVDVVLLEILSIAVASHVQSIGFDLLPA